MKLILRWRAAESRMSGWRCKRDCSTEELVLALPAGPCTGPRKRAITIGDLKGERLIVMKAGHCLGDQVLGFLATGAG